MRRIATFKTEHEAERDARKYDYARVSHSKLKPLVVKPNDDGTWSVWNPGNVARTPVHFDDDDDLKPRPQRTPVM